MNIKIYGKKLDGKQETESAEMITFFNVLKNNYPHLSKIATHIKNEGKRNFNQTQHQKMSGMIKGFSDIIIVGNPTFVCEMKSKSKRAVISKEQKEFLENAQNNGAFACIAYGCDGAIEALEDWLNASRR